MRLATILAALATLFCVAGCETSTETSTATSTTTSYPVGETPEVGDLVPDISGTDTDGVTFQLSDYKGKVIMLDFWGDW